MLAQERYISICQNCDNIISVVSLPFGLLPITIIKT